MFEVGFSELLVIAALALIVLGPEKLPKVVGEIGRWMGRARAMARQFRELLEEEAAEVQRKAEAPVVSQTPATHSSAEAQPAADMHPPGEPYTPPEVHAPTDPHTSHDTHVTPDTPPTAKPDDERRA